MELTGTSLIFFFMKKRSSWDEQQLDRLRQHVVGGGSVYRASVIFKRPVFQIRLKAREIGCPFPTLRQIRAKTRIAASQRINHVDYGACIGSAYRTEVGKIKKDYTRSGTTFLAFG